MVEVRERDPSPYSGASVAGLGCRWRKGQEGERMAGTGEDRPRVREYRAPIWLPLFVIVFFGGFGLTALRPVFEEDMPSALAIVMVAVVASVYFLLVVVTGASRTVVDEDHVAVRRLFRTRRTAWRDIQAIEIEGYPYSLVPRTQPAAIVVVRDRDGRKITLPHLHDKRGLSVHQEVLAMRAIWERRRGDDWTPLPDAETTVAEEAEAEARTRRDRPWRQPGPGV
ncbi:PH domain-containing protein [Streptomyces sp. NBS 14/10]|uniref:PH domain-containing protein n=1 Tax=Streptomyces sp. NBS 14/10 TaxID=1945643 RepID=UPI0015C68CE6|nr:PH domain-containing protein [Streptomyces sp. NBS 14/10]KAK1178599.1 PH domain-containing protein [Streptomyces sp. NBS 14/10]